MTEYQEMLRRVLAEEVAKYLKRYPVTRCTFAGGLPECIGKQAIEVSGGYVFVASRDLEGYGGVWRAKLGETRFDRVLKTPDTVADPGAPMFVKKLVAAEGRVFVVFYDYYTYYSDDHGKTWSRYTPPFHPHFEALDGRLVGMYRIASTDPRANDVYSTDVYGLNPTVVSTLEQAFKTGIQNPLTEVFLVSSGDYAPRRIFRSTDLATWTPVLDQGEYPDIAKPFSIAVIDQMWYIHAVDRVKVFMTSSENRGVVMTEDDGDSWELVSSFTDLGFGTPYHLCVSPISSDRVFLGCGSLYEARNPYMTDWARLWTPQEGEVQWGNGADGTYYFPVYVRKYVAGLPRTHLYRVIPSLLPRTPLKLGRPRYFSRKGSIDAGATETVVEILGGGRLEHLTMATDYSGIQLRVGLDGKVMSLAVLKGDGVTIDWLSPLRIQANYGGEDALMKNYRYDEAAARFVTGVKQPIEFSSRLVVQVYNPDTTAAHNVGVVGWYRVWE